MKAILPNANPNATESDVILVGAGIMSATLGVLLKEVEPAQRHEDEVSST